MNMAHARVVNGNRDRSMALCRCEWRSSCCLRYVVDVRAPLHRPSTHCPVHLEVSMNSSFKSALMAMLAIAACVATPAAVFADAAKTEGRVFELRTYTTPEGKLDDLHKRFREHTMKIFERHGMTNVGYWIPQDAPLAGHTLIYVISHKSRADAKKNWAEFGADPEWQKVKAASEANGPVVTKVESVFMDATDYSPMK